jgi:hypothetical protein
MIIGRYVRKELNAEQAMELLGLKRRQFFEWVRRYRGSSEGFSIGYVRQGGGMRITREVEAAILKELRLEKRLIDNPDLPIRTYNYSYIRNRVRTKYGHEVSLPTIIDRAKKTAVISPGARCGIMTVRSLRTMSAN